MMIPIASSFFYFYVIIFSILISIYLILNKLKYMKKWIKIFLFIFLIISIIDITYFIISYNNASYIQSSVHDSLKHPTENLIGIERTRHTVDYHGRNDTISEFHARFFIFNYGDSEIIGTRDFRWYERFYKKYLITFKRSKGKFNRQK